MSITVTCDECERSIRVRDEAVGKRFRCKGCGKILVVQESYADIRGLKSSERTLRRKPRSQIHRSASRAMPKLVKGVVLGLVGLGMFLGLVCVIALQLKEDKETFIVGTIHALIGIASGLMVWKRVPGAKGLAILFSIPMFLAFPIGTFIAWKIVKDISSEEVRHYLAR